MRGLVVGVPLALALWAVLIAVMWAVEGMYG